MDGFNIFLLIVTALFLIFVIRRYLRTRNIARYFPRDAASKVKAGKAMFLDVRTKPERDKRKINGSHHIPLHELKGRMGELSRYKDKEIICYCQSGNRSLNAASILNSNGYNAANLRGGIMMWERMK
jgi:rhodanese-related sulfurtransferase